MKKSVWLTFDLGVKGDYEALYAWLDNLDAEECGNNVAYFKFEVTENSGDELLDRLEDALRSAIDFSKSDRVYVTYLGEDSKIKGRFLVGNRRAAPWVGYGDVETLEDV